MTIIQAKQKLTQPVDNDGAGAVTQIVKINGKVVSQQTDSTSPISSSQFHLTPSTENTGAGALTYIYSSNECYLGTCGTLQEYSKST